MRKPPADAGPRAKSAAEIVAVLVLALAPWCLLPPFLAGIYFPDILTPRESDFAEEIRLLARHVRPRWRVTGPRLALRPSRCLRLEAPRFRLSTAQYPLTGGGATINHGLAGMLVLAAGVRFACALRPSRATLRLAAATLAFEIAFLLFEGAVLDELMLASAEDLLAVLGASPPARHPAPGPHHTSRPQHCNWSSSYPLRWGGAPARSRRRRTSSAAAAAARAMREGSGLDRGGGRGVEEGHPALRALSLGRAAQAGSGLPGAGFAWHVGPLHAPPGATRG